MAHEEERYVPELLLCVVDGPMDVFHLVDPTCFSPRAGLAFVPLSVKSGQSEAPLVNGKHRDALLSQQRMEVGVAPDVLCEAMNIDDRCLRRNW